MQDKEGETLKKKTGKIQFLEVQTVLMCLTCKESLGQLHLPALGAWS